MPSEGTGDPAAGAKVNDVAASRKVVPKENVGEVQGVLVVQKIQKICQKVDGPENLPKKSERFPFVQLISFRKNND